MLWWLRYRAPVTGADRGVFEGPEIEADAWAEAERVCEARQWRAISIAPFVLNPPLTRRSPLPPPPASKPQDLTQQARPIPSPRLQEPGRG